MRKTVLLLAIFCLVSTLDACSTFFLKKDEQYCLAKGYDWVAEDGLVVVNKRDIAKRAIMTQSKPLEWVSKYGSITFTQIGRELPMGGMNEQGLVIELMWLKDTTYPSVDDRCAVNELQWIQYQLDTASSVEEVIASDPILRIDANSTTPLHFLIADRFGHCASIEFINGQMVAHSDQQMLTPVLTNHTYQASVDFLKTHQGFGGEQAPGDGFQSLDRFVRLALQLKEFSAKDCKADVPTTFSILSGVSEFGAITGALNETMGGAKAQWNIVYDIPAKEIHFLTAQNKNIRTIQMNAFNFEGNTAVTVLDMQAQLQGDVSRAFIPYTTAINKQLIDGYYDKVSFLKTLPAEVRELIASYPESTFYKEIALKG